MTTVNRARLLAVVNGDWSPYQTVQRVAVHTGTMAGETLESVETDFDLLRHDIHVLCHASHQEGAK